MASLPDRFAAFKKRWRARQLEHALKRRSGPKVGGVSHKVPPEHHNRGTGG